MRKAILRLIVLAIFAHNLTTNSFADITHPPKLESVVQMTQGPYKPGDLIQFKLNISGGAPQLRDSNITGSSDCFTNPGNPDPPKGSQFDPMFWSINIRTYIISSACPDGINNIQSVSVSDVTGLIDLVVGSANNLPASWQFEVVNQFRMPKGLVQPTFDVSQDKVVLREFKNIGIERTTVNKISLNSGSIKINLPKLTELGFVIRWNLSGYSTGCRFIQRFPGDTQLLEFFSKGSCGLTAYVWQPNGLLTNVNGQSAVFTPQGNYSFLIDSEVRNSKVSITCVKGKLIKRVSGTNPKCPKGYKIKV